MESQMVCQHCQFVSSIYSFSKLTIQEWSEESHLALMANLGITRSILSISSPGTFLTHEDTVAARKLARECNDFAAELVSRRPSQFGFWASLPLPDVGGSLEEIAYAFDELHADGITLSTNFHGTYLGDKKFDPIFEELNGRKAKVFIHPTTPCRAACQNRGPILAATLPQFPSPMFEFFFDTARAVINLFVSGTIARCPDITFIIPHAGGALPPLIERMTAFSTLLPSARELSLSSDVVKETFGKQFYFDLAGMPFPDQIHGLLRYVDSRRLLYGSDFPFTPGAVVGMLARRMEGESGKIWTKEEVSGVLMGNAGRMLASSEENEKHRL
jgi:predicted TIM-barrel fold metal-dependent hydrolase